MNVLKNKVRTVDYWLGEEFQKAITKKEYEDNFAFTERIPFGCITALHEEYDDSLRVEYLVKGEGKVKWYKNCFGTWRP
jgi:hypothetical protein